MLNLKLLTQALVHLTSNPRGTKFLVAVLYREVIIYEWYALTDVAKSLYACMQAQSNICQRRRERAYLLISAHNP